MQLIHTPKIGARYWVAITLASIFGTNLGDFYAHSSGLGLIGGVPILLAIFAVIYGVERMDKTAHQVWYWLAIIVIRTGATNIADFTAFRLRMNVFWLLAMLILMLVLLVLQSRGSTLVVGSNKDWTKTATPPETSAKYWGAMLVAGVFGTVLGDVCAHAMGVDLAALILGAILAVVLFFGRGGLLATLFYYWFAIAVARTAGTAIGDWFAESHKLNLGLNVSTILTGTVFVMTLLLWKEWRVADKPIAA